MFAAIINGAKLTLLDANIISVKLSYHIDINAELALTW
jgi:hypothetical protein